MSFFIDTNLALGYTVIHDKWHEKADTFVNDANERIFWSNLVQNEYYIKLNDILDEIDIFLKTAENILKNNDKDFINYYSFENYILKRTKRCEIDKFKKQKILEHFWTKYGIFEGISEVIYLKFKKFNKNFKKMYFKRDKELNNNLIIHNCGVDNYKKYLNYAKQLNNWGVHPPDCKIVTDAHDCGLQHDNVIFVSTDEKMINTILEHAPSFLSIIEFRSCN